MKTCPNCKITGIPNNATFCPSCGQPIITTHNPWEENRQKQLQKANADLIEMKNKLIAFESERRRFFAELMQSDSYIDDLQVNISIIKGNRKKELDYHRVDDRSAVILYIFFVIILVGAMAYGYKSYQSLNVVGINLSTILELFGEIIINCFIFIIVPFCIISMIILKIILSKYNPSPLINNNTTLEIKGFYEKHQELYSYMHITFEDEIIDAEQNSNKILEMIKNIDGKLNKIE